jgi:hypothetical protein
MNLSWVSFPDSGLSFAILPVLEAHRGGPIVDPL